MLFVMANIARHLKLDPEAALRDANQKFIRRFAHIETRLAEDGKTPNESSLAEMDALWDEAKAIDKHAVTKPRPWPGSTRPSKATCSAACATQPAPRVFPPKHARDGTRDPKGVPEYERRTALRSAIAATAAA